MKSISIQQPWASLIVGGPRSPGVKRTENRSAGMAKWARSMIGERIAIHASRSKTTLLETLEDLLDGMFEFQRSEFPYAKPNEFPLGAIVGVATLGRVFGPGEDPLSADEARFYVGNDLCADDTWGLRFDDAQWLKEPITAKGALGFWRLGDELEREVAERIGRGE